jgi:nucleoside-diphosphate-sugar epimerase
MASKINVHAEVYVAGGSGLVGSAIGRRLAAADFSDMLTSPRLQPDAARAHALRGA